MASRKSLVIIAILLSILILSIVLAIAFGQYTTRPNYIYDNANIISEEDKQLITDFLRDFDERTTVEIVIYTTESLEGKSIDDVAYDIFNKTPLDGVIGIGKSDKDNGLLILVAMEEREWKILPGDGISPIIPSTIAKQIGDDNLTPKFKEGKYAEGFYLAVKAIVERLENSTIEIPTLVSRGDNLMQRVMIYAGTFAAAIVAAILGYVTFIRIGKRIQRFWGERILAKQNRAKANELTSHIKSLKDRIDRADDDIGNFPGWAKEDVQEAMQKAYLLLGEMESAVNEVQRTKDQDPYKAHDKLLEAEENARGIDKTLKDASVDIQNKFVKYKEDAPKKLSKLKSNMEETGEFLNKLEKEGFTKNVPMWKMSLIEVESSVGFIEVMIKNTVLDFKPACESADKALDKVGKISKFSHEMRDQANSMRDAFVFLPKDISEIESRLRLAEDKLQELKSASPNSVWEKTEYNFDKVYSLLSMAKGQINAAGMEGSMEVQNFSKASEHLTDAKGNVDKARQYVLNVFDKLKEYSNAKASAGGLFEKARSEIKNAGEETQESNVKEYPRELYRKALGLLKRAESARGMSLIDWILIVALLNQAINTASEATRKAREDVEEHRKRVERERRRREDEQRWSYHSSSHSSSDSSWGSSGGSWGGGISSGGGASGHW